MQGRQRIKDILAAFTDPTDPDSPSRLKTVKKALNALLTQQYLRTVSWWNLMPPDEVMNKIALEEEKKLRKAGASTSVSMTAKTQKEAAKAADERIQNMKKDERNMESLKRKVVDKEEASGPKKRRLMAKEDEEEEHVKFDYDVCTPAISRLIGFTGGYDDCS
jgi:50S ribosomal subunit-associated GTPase HflX